MYEKFKRWLASLFGYTVISEQKIIEQQYKDLTRRIFYARSLNELILAQLELKAFIRYVDSLGNPYWAKGRVEAAKRYWHKRYALWKSRG